MFVCKFAGNFCVRRGRARGHGRRVDGDVRGRLLDQGRLHDAQARGHRHVPGSQRAHLRQTDPRTGTNLKIQIVNSKAKLDLNHFITDGDYRSAAP